MDSTESSERILASKMSSMDLDLPKKLFFPTPKQFRETCSSQVFSLPDPIMEYILINPSSSEVYQKLIKSCKIAFLKNPLFVCDTLYHWEEEWYCCGYSPGCKHFQDGKCRKTDLEEDGDKIWVTDNLDIIGKRDHFGELSYVASLFIPKIHRYNVKELVLARQNLTYNELKFFSTGVKKCSLSCNIVKYQNGEEVPLEEIVKLFSDCKEFCTNFVAEPPNNAAIKNYGEFFEACRGMDEFLFLDIEEEFDVATFFKEMKKHKNRAIFLFWSDYIDYRFNGIIVETLLTQSFDYVPLVYEVKHGWEYWEKTRKMEDIQKREATKYR